MNLSELQQALKDLVYNNTSGQSDPAINYFGDTLGDIIDEFVKTNVPTEFTFKGGYNAATNVPNLDTPPTIPILRGDAYKVTVAGNFFSQYVLVNSLIIAIQDNPTLLSHWLITEDTSLITIENQGANRVVTATATPNSLYAHDQLIFDGNELSVYGDLRVTDILYTDSIRKRTAFGIDIEGVLISNKAVSQIDSINFNLVPYVAGYQEGNLYWNNIDKTLNLEVGEGITQQMGQEIHVRVINLTGSTLLNGKVVYINSADSVSARPSVRLSNSRDAVMARRSFGLLTMDILDGEEGVVTTFGKIRDIDTSSFTLGDCLFISDVDGELTNTPPIDGLWVISIGIATKIGVTDGEIFVKNIQYEKPNELNLIGGFPNQNIPVTTISFNNTNRTFTIAPTGSSFHFYQLGVQYVKNTSEDLVLPDTEGFYSIYYNLGSLAYILNPTFGQQDDLIRNRTYVAQLYWDADNNQHLFLGNERHGFVMSSDTHSYLHFAEGSRWLGGMGLNTISADQTGDLDPHAQFGVDSGIGADEDLIRLPSPLGSTVGMPIFYLSGSGAYLRKTSQSGFSVLTDITAGIGSTGRLVYNQFTGGAWQLTVVNNLDYVLCHIFSTNSVSSGDRYISFIGQATYSSLTSARTGAEGEIGNIISVLPKQELIPIATIIFQTSNIYSNSVKARIRTTAEGNDYIDWRVSDITASGLNPTDHENLSGLLGGVIGEHYHITSAQHTTVTNLALGTAYLDTINELTLNHGVEFAHKIIGPVSTLGSASLNIPHGLAPTSPVNGDLWTTSTGLYLRVNGSTVGPMTSANGTLNYIPKFTSASTFGNSLLYDAGTRIGIDNTSPVYKLDVYGATATDGISTNVGLNLRKVAPAGAPTLTLAAGGSVDVGSHYYNIVFYNALGDTSRGVPVEIITTSGNQTVQLTNIPISTDGSVIGRKIYRSKIGEGSSYGWLVATITNNTATTYTDSVADSTLTEQSGNYNKVNNTNNFITVNSIKSMVIDAYLAIFGYNVGVSMTSGASNALFGASVGPVITTGSNNTMMGTSVGMSLTTGTNNIAIGANSYTYSTGSFNIAIGQYNLQQSTGSYNIAIGYSTGNSLTSATDNIIIGGHAGAYMTGGYNNVMGRYAMGYKTGAGVCNVAIGSQALQGTYPADPSSYNVAVGYQAGIANGTGSNNTFIGSFSGYANITADGNVFIGYGSGRYETTANNLFIDNATRASESDGRAKALIYGKFASVIASQTLLFNAVVSIPLSLSVDTINEYTASAGVTIDGLLIKDEYIEFDEITTPAAPSANKGRLYMDSSDEHIYFRNSTTTFDLTLAGGGDTFKTWHTGADSGYTWATSDVVASGNDTMDIIPGTGIAIDTDATSKAIRIRATGSGGLANAYASMTDGTTTATAVAADTFKFRTANTALSLVVTNNDATHGDNILFTINVGNIDHNSLSNYDSNRHIDHTAVSISTQYSLTGGGSIASTRTLNLVNDSTAPGNNMLYGTDGSGVRGWISQTAHNHDSSYLRLDQTTPQTVINGRPIFGVGATFSNYSIETEITPPGGTPISGTGYFYAAADNTVGKLYWKNDDGDVFDLTRGSALGASVSSSWKFNTAITNSDPGSKQFKMNNAAYASVTSLYFNDTTVNGGDCSGVFSLMPVGSRIYIQQLNDGTKIAMYEISSKTDNTGWWTLGVTYIGSTGTLFSSNTECGTILYAPSNSPMTYPSAGIAVSTGTAWGTSLTASALTKTDDTNVTLTLGGTPNTALLQSVSLTLGWSGTLADGRIASASNWNSKQAGSSNLTSLSGLTYTSTAFVKMTGANTFTLDTNTYLTTIPADVVRTGQVNTYGNFAQTFRDNIIRINNPADTFYYTLTAGAIAANRILNLPVITADDTIAVLGLAQTYTVAQTFRAVNAVRVEAASTQDAIIFAGRAGGTSSYAVTLTPTTLTGSRVITLPDRTITLDYITTSTDTSNGYIKGVASKVTFVTSIPITDLASSTISGISLGNNLNSLTINSSGSGGASPQTYNGSAAITISYNTIGAQPLNSNLTSLSSLSYTSTAFVKMTGANTFTLDTNTYLTSVTSHNLLSATHGDTVTGTVARGDIIVGNSTPAWNRLAFPATPTGKILQATATDIVWSTNPITIGASASISGSNTGDVSLATDHGLSLTGQQLAMGTPSNITSSSSNSVTTTTHTHAITAGLGFIGNGSAQYQVPVTGSTPFTPVWTTSINLFGTSGLNALTWSSGTVLVGMTAANTFGLQTATQVTALLNLFATTSTTQGLVPGSNNLGVTYFLRADGTWAVPASGNVSSTGTPVDNQIAIWTNATTIEGSTGLTYSGTVLGLTGYVLQDTAVDIRVGANKIIYYNPTDATVRIGGGAGNDTMTQSISHVLIGSSAGNSIGANNGCVFIGAQTGSGCTTGTYNTGIGGRVLQFVGTGQQNMALGFSAMRYSTGSYNAVVGYSSFQGASGLSAGSYNCALGNLAGSAGRGANLNVVIGYQSMVEGQENIQNVYIGGYAAVYNWGSYNVAIGYNALRGVTGGGSTASYNTVIGWQAGDSITTGTYNLLLGYNVDTTAATTTHQFRLGYSTTYLLEGSMTSTIWVGTDYEFRTDVINEYTASAGVAIDGVLVKDYIIDAQDGVSKHLTITAGDASGAAGTDAGNLYLRAGNAINADSGSIQGHIYLIPGLAYDGAAGTAFVYLGGDTTTMEVYSIRTIGSASNINLDITPKGTGYLNLGGASTNVYSQGFFTAPRGATIGPIGATTINVRLGRTGTIGSLIAGQGLSIGTPNGDSLGLFGGEGNSEVGANGNGGHVYIYGGTPSGTGTRGNIYFGSGSTCYLNIDDTETYLVAVDPTSGLLSRRAVSSISGTNYWSRTGTTLSPVTTGDDIGLGNGDAIFWGTSYLSADSVGGVFNFYLPSNVVFKVATTYVSVENGSFRVAHSSGSNPWNITNTSGSISAAHEINNSGTGYNLSFSGGQSNSTTATHYGGNITLKGGNQAGTGGGRGGEVFIYGGSSVSSTRGSIYLGDGSSFCALAVDDTETYLVAVDPTTGLLSRRAVSSIGGGGVSYVGGTDVNDRVLTATGSNTINGEANLTFNGSTLTSSSGYLAGVAADGVAINTNAVHITVSSTTHMSLTPAVTDGSTAVAYRFNTVNSLTNATARLFSVTNQGVERFYVSSAGIAVIRGVQPTLQVSDGTYTMTFYVDSSSHAGLITNSTGNINIVSSAKISFQSQTGIDFDLISTGFTSSTEALMESKNGYEATPASFTIRGGRVLGSVGNYNGGNIRIFGGSGLGTGTRGNIYFGDGSNGFLPAKGSETNVIYYDTATGKLSYGTVSSGGISWNGSTANAIGTYNSSTLIDAEATLTYDSSTGELKIAPTNLDAYLTFYNSTTQHGSVGYDYNNSYVKLNYGAITNAHIAINSSGYVGIGAVYTGTTYRLYVTGQIYATDNITAYSDIRGKNIISEFHGGLNKLMNINPIIYERKDRLGSRIIGFSAQELREQYSEIGVYDDEQDKFGVDMMGMVAWNTISIKELKKEKDDSIADLKRQIEKLKDEIDYLRIYGH